MSLERLWLRNECWILGCTQHWNHQGCWCDRRNSVHRGVRYDGPCWVRFLRQLKNFLMYKK